jgi:hypothetical protein
MTERTEARIGVVIALVIMGLLFIFLISDAYAQQRAQQNDPSPRFQLLGRELLQTPNTSAPAKVFVYWDKVTRDEIVCFSGESRETLSCYRSGRQR